MSGPIGWLEEEIAWVRARADWPRRDLWRAFCNFWRRDVSLGAFKGMCKREGIMTGRTGQIEKGHVPLNKGRKMPFNAASAATQFKPGQKPHNARPVGYERIDEEGYVQICVDEPNPWTGARTHMAFKHRRLWEEVNGPVPEGHRLKCLDGDKTNCDPANWEAVPMALAPRLNGRFGRGYDQAPADLKPTIMAIAKLEHKARTARRGGAA
jgi:hypothetical protein